MDTTKTEFHAMETIQERWQALEDDLAAHGFGKYDRATHRNTYFTACASMLELASKRILKRTNLPEPGIADIFSDLLGELREFVLEQEAMLRDKNH